MRRHLATLALVALTGCAGEEPGVHLYIDTTATLGALDTFQVEVTASSPEGRACEPVTGLLPVHGREDLPAYVLFDRGDTYTEHLAYRVRASLRGEPVSEVRGGWISWAEADRQVIEIVLDVECFNLAARCAPDEHCQSGICSPLDLPSALTDQDAIDRGTSCFRAE